MKYQAKVKNIEKYSDSQGEHVVCRGKLILLKGGLDKPNHLTINGEFYNPIIISETEEPKVGDWVYYATTNEIMIAETQQDLNTSACKKVLAFPEHFSDKHLQAIVDDKMKDGDEVLVKCVNYPLENENPMLSLSEDNYKIHLNQQNKITLFPVKDKERVYTLEFREGNDISSMTVLVGEKVEKLESFIKENKDFAKGENWWWVILEGNKYEAKYWNIHSIYTSEGKKVDNQPIPVKQSLEEASENYAYDSNESYNTPVKFYRDQLQHKSIRDFKAGAEWAKKNKY